MIAYVTQTLEILPNTKATQDMRGSWLKDFGNLINSLQLRSQEITSLLCIVAAAISTGKPMPPYLKVPQRIHLGQLLDNKNTDILSTRHVLEPGYAAFAVMQVSSAMLEDDLEGLLEETKNLVGETKLIY